MLHKNEYQERWTSRVVPVRVRSRVVPVPVETAVIAIVRVTTGDQVNRSLGAIAYTSLCNYFSSYFNAKRLIQTMLRGIAIPLNNPPQGDLRRGRAAQFQFELEAVLVQIQERPQLSPLFAAPPATRMVFAPALT